MFGSWLVFHSDSRLVRETTQNTSLEVSIWLCCFFFFFFAFSRRADLFIYDFLVNY